MGRKEVVSLQRVHWDGKLTIMQFGSLQSLKQKMMVEGAALQGSSWVWLALDKDQKKLSIECTANQDPLIIKGANYVPLLGIDVWEHAYYLQYKNVRPVKCMRKSILEATTWCQQSCRQATFVQFAQK